MKIKTTLKKIKRGDILKINWIDAGDINDVASSWFSEETAENVFKEIPVETIAVYFGHGKETLFLVRDTEDIKLTYL
jgi:TusA-related sulfurtransferase